MGRCGPPQYGRCEDHGHSPPRVPPVPRPLASGDAAHIRGGRPARTVDRERRPPRSGTPDYATGRGGSSPGRDQRLRRPGRGGRRRGCACLARHPPYLERRADGRDSHHDVASGAGEAAWGYLAAGIASVAAMAYSGYLGGHLVYEHGVGVRPAEGVEDGEAPEIRPGEAREVARRPQRMPRTEFSMRSTTCPKGMPFLPLPARMHTATDPSAHSTAERGTQPARGPSTPAPASGSTTRNEAPPPGELEALTRPP